MNCAVSDPEAFAGDILELEMEIATLAAHINAATWRLLALVRCFDLRRGWNNGGARSCAHWLNWKCGIAVGAAREKVRVAHALPKLPQISEAFREGRLSYSKVRAMTRVATPKNEEYLLMIARHGTASHMERLVRSYRRLGRQEALDRDRQREDERVLTWHIDEDGCYVLRARLPPEQGALVVRALDAVGDETRAQKSDSVEAPKLNQIQSQNQNQTQTQTRNSPQSRTRASPRSPTSPEPRSRTIAPREQAMLRADALAQLADSYLAGARAGRNGGDRYTLHLHTDLATLRTDGHGAESETGEGINVSAEVSRRLACDCAVVPWKKDKDAGTINLGRRTRTISSALRRALQHRDGGCGFPGCTARHHLDAHHVVHWADGGPTDLENLLLLCRYHHRLVHEGGFSVTKDAVGKARFSDPQGRPLADAPESRFRGNVGTLLAENRDKGLGITGRTLPPHWHGERMDLGMAAQGLIRRGVP